MFPYDTELSPDYDIKRQQFKWCTENLGMRDTAVTYKTKHLVTWHTSGQDRRMRIHFKNKEDLVWFLLRWT